MEGPDGRRTRRRFAQAEGAAAAPHGDDRAVLAGLVLLAWTGVVLCRLPREAWQPGSWATLYAACLVVQGCCLAWPRLAPGSWRKWRFAGAVAARLAALPLSLSLHLGSKDPRLLSVSREQSFADQLQAAPTQLPSFLFMAAYSSGTFMLVLTGVGLRLPPVPAALLQAAGAAAMSLTNAAHCALPMMRLPQTEAHVATAYRWLEPLIAPLEPLLWLAGVGAAHPNRRCMCVLAALQFWGGLVLPLAAVLAAEARAFRAYRRQRLQQTLLERRREDRVSQRYWTRAAAAARRQSSARRGLPFPDSPSTSTSSGPSSPESAEEERLVAAQAEALVEAPAPEGLLQPGEWQHEAAYQLYLRLRELAGWPSLLLLSALCLLYAWHVLAFP